MRMDDQGAVSVFRRIAAWDHSNRTWRTLLRCTIGAALSLVLSLARTRGGLAPFGVAFVAAAGTGWVGASALLGAAGGYLDRYGYPFCRGRALQNVEKDHGQYDDPADVFWISGACLMVRSKLWKKLGGLDDRFFAHMEEIDLCWRIQLAGYRVTSVPRSTVYHIGGGTLPNESPFKLRLNYRNNLLLLENNLAKTFRAQGYSVDGALAKARRRILARMLLDGASALVYLVTKKWPSYKAVVKAHAEYWKLRRKPSPDEVASQQKEVTIHGWYSKWMVPRALSGKIPTVK